MTHAESGALLAYLDGELAGSRVSALEEHLGACAACREEMDSLRAMAAELSGALGLISPEIGLADARSRFERRRRAAAPAPARLRRSWRFAGSGLLKAAAVVLLLAGAASAAIPGSPVRRWASALLDRLTGSDAPAPVTPSAVEPGRTPDIPASQESADVTEVVLSAQAGRVRVSVHAADPSARIIVRLVDGEGGIHATTPSEPLRFRTGSGYVDVYDVRTGVVIEIPRSLRAAVVEVDGRVFWRKDGDELRLLEPTLEDAGGEAVFRARS